MTITTVWRHSTRAGNFNTVTDNSWRGIVLFCALMAALLFVGAVTGSLDHPLAQDMSFASP